MRLAILISLLVGGAVGAAAAMATKKTVPGADAGDWLSFAGALVGVVVTIAGALWLEHHKSTTQQRKERQILLRCLADLRSALNSASQPRGDNAILEERPARILAESELMKNFEKFRYAKRFVPNRNIDAWQKIESLDEEISECTPIVAHEKSLIIAHGDSEPVFLINIQRMLEIKNRLTPHIDVVIKSLK